MPNWVKNIVHISGPEEDVAKAIDFMRDKNPKYEHDIDFNNILPMPERLNIVSGGSDRGYVALYLKTLSVDERRQLQDELNKRTLGYYGTYSKKYADSFAMADGTMDIPEGNLSWMRKHFERDYSHVKPSSMEDVGKAYIDNILEYGHDTWYEWCIDNWGTKWNACETTILENGFEFNTAWSTPIPIIEALSSKFPELTFRIEWADENLGYNCGTIECANGEIALEEYPNDDEAYNFACMIWGYEPDDLED